MRQFPAFLSVFSLFVVCADAALAQTAAKPPSNRQIFRLDSNECASHRFDLFADCMNRKQAERKEAARARRADCTKQADEQELRLLKRRNFIKGCVKK